jgi:hypothetical protein
MRVVTVARRPCAEPTVTQNVLKRAAGALNIDACRIGTGDGGTREGEETRAARYTERGGTNFSPLPGPRGGDARGRWPANLLLQHQPGCRQTGTVRMQGYRINRWTDGAKPFGGGAGHDYDSEQLPDEDVPVWECVGDCSVLALGEQSGSQKDGTYVGRNRAGVDRFGHNTFGTQMIEPGVDRSYGGSGTAARYFKQVQGMNDAITQEIWDYLYLLIAPPEGCDPLVIADSNLGGIDFSKFEDGSVHGLITCGDPSPWLSEIDRVLRPGAHVLLISDETDWTGATGACAIEDFGYEIRDAVAVLDTAGEFNYAAKAATKERNDGVLPHDRLTVTDRLFPKEDEDIDELREELLEIVEPKLLKTFLKEGLPLAEIPEEMHDRFDVRTVELRRMERNSHPTVKSLAIMEALLEGVPKGATVLDSFMGSGTTGLACLRRGLNFIGIENEAEYLTIADQRIRHWDRKEAAWNGADIESEATDFVNETVLEGGLFDIFGEDT